jgi:hypothetical protein
MAQKATPTYTLGRAVVAATATPDPFHLPPPEERTALRVGDQAQLVFEAQQATERMWVTVIGRFRDTAGGTAYVGTLTHTPVGIPLPPGHKVMFRPEHVWSSRPKAE